MKPILQGYGRGGGGGVLSQCSYGDVPTCISNISLSKFSILLKCYPVKNTVEKKYQF